MIPWLNLNADQRKISLEQAELRSGLLAKAIEKDWWVTLILKALFSSEYSSYCIFKGGTSLSKGWKLINRMSEDVDISLDPEAFGKPYQTNPSRTFVKALKRYGCTFTSTVLKKSLEDSLIQLGLPTDAVQIEAAAVSQTFPDTDPQTLYIKYPSVYDPHPYIADEVRVEFSVRSLKEPSTKVYVQSILHEFFPANVYQEIPFEINVAEPRKTFLEKAFLLHEKFAIAQSGKVNFQKQSRHLIDLYKLMDTPFGKDALNDHSLYKEIVHHRENYNHVIGVSYNTLLPEHISFVPPDFLMDVFRDDYAKMQQEMIYGNSPSFNELIDQLVILNEWFRNILI